MKLTIIVENGTGGDIWGRIHYGEDLLTSVAETEEKLKENFGEQLRDFYQVDPATVTFAIEHEQSAEVLSEEINKLRGALRKALNIMDKPYGVEKMQAIKELESFAKQHNI